MNETIDFKRLPKDGARFESLVAHLFEAMGYRILEPPAVGADAGRDLLVERLFTDALGERRYRVVVQCKHFAHSGRSVSERDLGVWQNSLVIHRAQGYHLVTSTRVNENVSRAFNVFNESHTDRFAGFWNGADLEKLLAEHRDVCDVYFPLHELADRGWGVVLPSGEQGEIQEALQPLLELRESQVRRGSGRAAFRIFSGLDGYRASESASDFLARHFVGPGSPDVKRVPFFLTLIGDASEIPFAFQIDLSLQYAVARLSFKTVQEYRLYARSVVAAENNQAARPREVTLVSIEYPNDTPTMLTAGLVSGLFDKLRGATDPWPIRLVQRGEATGDRLRELLGGPDATRLMFVTAHGRSFKYQFEQPPLEGAIVTADWLGPGHPIAGCSFGAEHAAADGNLQGTILFLFSCQSAGTSFEEFNQNDLGSAPEQTEDRVTPLAQRLLTLPNGGALAVIGHIGNVWTHSFYHQDLGLQPQTIYEVLETLMRGAPVGVAMQSLIRRYAQFASMAATALAAQMRGQEMPDLKEFETLWRTMIDARNYIALGDPAVRLSR